MSFQKNYSESLNFIKKLVNNNLIDKYHIYGSGILRPELEKYVKENNLESYVSFKGNVNRVPYKDYDFTLFFSHYESQGLIILESWSNGVPVCISKSLFSMLDYLNDDNSLILIDNENPINKIKIFMKNNRKEVIDKCHNNYENILSKQSEIINKWKIFFDET